MNARSLTTQTGSKSETASQSVINHRPRISPASCRSSFSNNTKPLIQAKLKIGAANDKYEQEADRVADRVMRMPEGQLTDAGSNLSKLSAAHSVQRLCTACNEELDEEVTVQTKAAQGVTPQVTSNVASGIKSLANSGQQLPGSSRHYFESRFRHDFSQVRIHADNKAAHLANSINARAFTLGRDVVFGAGQYQPHSREGQRLIAHELAHTIQQNSATRISRQPENKSQSTLSSVPRGVIQREEQRTCRAQVGTNNPSTVSCSDGANYEVRTNVTSGTVPSTEAGAMAGLERSTLYFQVRVCRGRDEVQITTSMDVAQPLRRLIVNAISGSPLGRGMRLEPEMRISWVRSSQFEAQVYGGPTFVEGAPRTGGRGGLRVRSGRFGGGIEVGSDPTLTGPGGRPEIHGRVFGEVSTGSVPEVDCSTTRYTVNYTCTPVTYTPRVEAIPADDIQLYVFFEYATDSVIAPTPRFLRNSQDLTGVSLASLAREGYRARAINAFTSPEGRRGASPRPRGFIGNDALSASRGTAALNWLRTHCQACIGAEPPINAQSELYSAWTRPGVEQEGDPLVATARRGFLGLNQTPPTPDPLRRPEHDILPTLSVDEQRARLYPLLRRAVIRLHREGSPEVPPQPRRGNTVTCPADVRRAMQGR
jgi:hypothetical protein